MAGSQVSTSVTTIDSLHGYQALSLTEYNTSAACSIAAGSVVEIAGAFFTFSSDEAIEASTWTAIVTATTAYITLTASGTAGSQIVVARYTSTAPEWRDDFQGWYASVGSSIRVVGSVYKAESTSYYPKYLYNPKVPDSYRQSGKQIFTTSGVFHVPLTVNQVYLTGCAAGGNGGNGEAGGSYRGGGGGGSSEIVYKKAFAVTPGQSVVVTIGLPGSNTSFGGTSFNCGVAGSNGSSGGSGGAGGSLLNGTLSGTTGGATNSVSGASILVSNVGFAGGGYTATAIAGTQGAGGGAGGLGNFVYYALNTAGTAGKGSFGGGGGGSYWTIGTTGTNGGNGGYGCGGGGGGPINSGTGGVGGSGGSAILIVEW
jgi:hypothetical protein